MLNGYQWYYGPHESDDMIDNTHNTMDLEMTDMALHTDTKYHHLTTIINTNDENNDTMDHDVDEEFVSLSIVDDDSEEDEAFIDAIPPAFAHLPIVQELARECPSETGATSSGQRNESTSNTTSDTSNNLHGHNGCDKRKRKYNNERQKEEDEDDGGKKLR